MTGLPPDALDRARIEIPLEVRTFYCAGLNYVEHVRQVAAKRGEEPNIPKHLDIGYRAINALIAHDEPVVIPADATERNGGSTKANWSW